MSSPTPPQIEQVIKDLEASTTFTANIIGELAVSLERLQLEGEGAKLLPRLDDATHGIEQLAAAIRQLKLLAWSLPMLDEFHDVDMPTEDTWDASAAGGSRILVVDDDPEWLSSVSVTLAHYIVSVAESGGRAIDIIDEGHDFDLILCDIQMGDISGLDVYRHVSRTRPSLAERITFMLDSTPLGTDDRAFMADLQNTVLNKPFDSKTLRWLAAQRVHQA